MPEGLIWRDNPLDDGTCGLGKREGQCCEEKNLQFIRNAISIYDKATNDKRSKTLDNARQWIRDKQANTYDYITVKNDLDGRYLLQLAENYESNSSVIHVLIDSVVPDLQELAPLIKNSPGYISLEPSMELSFNDIHFLTDDDTKLKKVEIGHYGVKKPADNLAITAAAQFLDTLALKYDRTLIQIGFGNSFLPFEQRLKNQYGWHGFLSNYYKIVQGVRIDLIFDRYRVRSFKSPISP